MINSVIPIILEKENSYNTEEKYNIKFPQEVQNSEKALSCYTYE